MRQRARDHREALLLNGGVSLSLGLAPLEPPLGGLGTGRPRYSSSSSSFLTQ